MIGYAGKLKSHLTRYKETRLGILERGVWVGNGKEYRHILPESMRRLNILETIRSEFWGFLRGRRSIKLHQDFCHLNSSQAMCFNLFFPWFGLEPGKPSLLLESFGLTEFPVSDWNFEHVPDSADGTNFDFWLNSGSGAQVVVEAKLSESSFGSAPPDPRHRMKRETIYLPRLQGRVAPEWLESESFFQHYQILRNIAFANPKTKCRVVFLLPRANEALQEDVRFIQTAPTPEVREYVKVIYLEDLVRDLRAQVSDPTLAAHFALLHEKYVIE